MSCSPTWSATSPTRIPTSSGVSRATTPDFLAVIDAEDGRIVHETPMPNVGDELHHFGWNRCSSACHGPDRSHLVVPGFRSSRIHIVNVADDPRRPTIERVIEPHEIAEKTGYTRPHTVHCMPGDNIVISMLGDVEGKGAGGFAVLDAQSFEIKGRWEDGGARPSMNYDFWYQPRKNVLISSEFGDPNAYEGGFDPADVEAGRYGRRVHFWDRAERRLAQTIDLGEQGLVPLECAGCTTRRPTRGSSERRCRARSGASIARMAPTAPSR
jgi:methanethiol oxidase